MFCRDEVYEETERFRRRNMGGFVQLDGGFVPSWRVGPRRIKPVNIAFSGSDWNCNAVGTSPFDGLDIAFGDRLDRFNELSP
jgi:hypothetical protein